MQCAPEDNYCHLCNLCHSIAAAGDWCTVLDTLAKGSLTVTGAQASLVTVLDGKRFGLEVGASAGLGEPLPWEGVKELAQSIIDQRAVSGEVVEITDISTGPDWPMRQQAVSQGLRSLLAVVLMMGERPIGVLHLYRNVAGPFSSDLKSLARTLATQAGIAMDRLRALRQARALMQISQAINSTLDTSEVLRTVVEQAARVLGFKAASIRILNEAGDQLEERAAFGLSERYLAKGPIEVDKSEVDREVLAGNSIAITEEELYAKVQYPEEVRAEGIRSIFCAPLAIKGQPIGVLRVYSTAAREFSESEAEFLRSLANQSATALENARLFEHLRRDYEDLRKAVWNWYDWGERPPRM